MIKSYSQRERLSRLKKKDYIKDMTLVRFRHNLPPLFISQKKRKARLTAVKMSIFLLAVIFFTVIAWNYYLEKALDDFQSRKLISRSETKGVEVPTVKNEPPPVIKEDKTLFVFAGDMMFDRMVNYRFKEDKILDIFSNFDRQKFQEADLVVANLEGPISDQPIPDQPSTGSMIFNFPPKTVDALKFLNITAVNLANNHTLNAGAQGFETTKRLLTENSIGSFGHQKEFADFSVYRATVGDLPISIIGINLLEGSYQLAIAEKIKQEKEAKKFVIIFAHWGSEYQNVHSTAQEQQAKDWISAGADLVIGSHPHVVQDVQRIDGVPVFYSLGNFVFDQLFSAETQKGLVIACKLTGDKIEISPLPTQSKQIKPEMVLGEEKTKIVKTIQDQLGLQEGEQFDESNGLIILKRK